MTLRLNDFVLPEQTSYDGSNLSRDEIERLHRNAKILIHNDVMQWDQNQSQSEIEKPFNNCGGVDCGSYDDPMNHIIDQISSNSDLFNRNQFFSLIDELEGSAGWTDIELVAPVYSTIYATRTYDYDITDDSNLIEGPSGLEPEVACFLCSK